VIVGIAADVCVKETALDARRFAYDTTVLRDAVRAVDPGAGLEGALEELRAAGVTVG
jgi:nicotinamidase/pyrazinamidase